MTTAGGQAERLNGLGTHVACVAHELKNPLSLIVGGLDGLETYYRALVEHSKVTTPLVPERAVGDGTPEQLAALVYQIGQLLGICRDGARRLKYVIRQLETYSTGESEAREHVDVRAAIEAGVRLAQSSRLVAPPVDIECRDLPALSVDGPALELVLANLIGNACDAVEGSPNPRVEVVARFRENFLEVPKVEIRVIDNGPGIPPALRGRIFEPFFTTKPRGSGLGLGLAICREVIGNQGGQLDLGPRTAGAEFIIQLPSDKPRAAPSASEPQHQAPHLHGGPLTAAGQFR